MTPRIVCGIGVALAALAMVLGAPGAQAEPPRFAQKRLVFSPFTEPQVYGPIDAPRPAIVRTPFAGGTLRFVGSGRAAQVVWEPPDGAAVAADLWRTRVPYSARTLDPKSEAGGVVRIAVEATTGGTDLKLVHRWEELFVPPTAERGPLRVRLVTGVTLHDYSGDEETPQVSGWERQVEVVPGGVNIVQSDGPLAWFRATGRYTWDALEREVPRWRKQAIRAISDETTRVLDVRIRADGFDFIRALDLLPGYVEPIGADETGAPDPFNRPSLVHLDEVERLTL